MIPILAGIVTHDNEHLRQVARRHLGQCLLSVCVDSLTNWNMLYIIYIFIYFYSLALAHTHALMYIYVECWRIRVCTSVSLRSLELVAHLSSSLAGAKNQRTAVVP